MTKETYEKITGVFHKSPAKRKCLVLADQILTKLAYVAYTVLLIVLVIHKDPGLLPAILVPGISFVAVSVFRHIYCAPRPYEVFDMPPVIPKSTKGNSFPSRHVFSTFIIAMTFFYFVPWLGILLGVLGIFMAISRVLSGVHFPKDVVAGAVIGVVCGIVGFYLVG